MWSRKFSLVYKVVNEVLLAHKNLIVVVTLRQRTVGHTWCAVVSLN